MAGRKGKGILTRRREDAKAPEFRARLKAAPALLISSLRAFASSRESRLFRQPLSLRSIRAVSTAAAAAAIDKVQGRSRRSPVIPAQAGTSLDLVRDYGDAPATGLGLRRDDGLLYE